MSERFLRLKEVRARVPVSRSTLYSKIRLGEFPRPIRIFGARAVAWRESDVDEWISARIAEGAERGRNL
jgi:prophage regulatory protein